MITGESKSTPNYAKIYPSQFVADVPVKMVDNMDEARKNQPLGKNQTTDSSPVDNDKYLQEFYDYDYYPRFARENPDATLEELDTVKNFWSTNNQSAHPGTRPQGLAGKYSLTDPGGIEYSTWHNSILRWMAAHENAHLLRLGRLGNIEGQFSSDKLGRTNRNIGSGYSPTELEYLDNGWQDLNYRGFGKGREDTLRRRYEQGAINTLTRFLAWKQLYDKLGRRPQLDETDKYILEMDPKEYEKLVYSTNDLYTKFIKQHGGLNNIKATKEANIHVADADTSQQNPYVQLSKNGSKLVPKFLNAGKVNYYTEESDPSFRTEASKMFSSKIGLQGYRLSTGDGSFHTYNAGRTNTPATMQAAQARYNDLLHYYQPNLQKADTGLSGTFHGIFGKQMEDEGTNEDGSPRLRAMTSPTGTIYAPDTYGVIEELPHMVQYQRELNKTGSKAGATMGMISRLLHGLTTEGFDLGATYDSDNATIENTHAKYGYPIVNYIAKGKNSGFSSASQVGEYLDLQMALDDAKRNPYYHPADLLLGLGKLAFSDKERTPHLNDVLDRGIAASESYQPTSVIGQYADKVADGLSLGSLSLPIVGIASLNPAHAIAGTLAGIGGQAVSTLISPRTWAAAHAMTLNTGNHTRNANYSYRNVSVGKGKNKTRVTIQDKPIAANDATRVARPTVQQTLIKKGATKPQLKLRLRK